MSCFTVAVFAVVFNSFFCYADVYITSV